MLDFNDAEAQREGGLIPEGEVALAVLSIRPGAEGPGGFLTKNKAGDKLMIDAEFTLASGKYERRKFWRLFITDPVDSDSARITRSQLRAALESAFAVDPGDDSDAAMAKRRADGYGAFDGLTVCVKVGIEKGKDGYADKNTLRAFITPDDAKYINPGPQQAGFKTAGAAVASGMKAAGGQVAAAAPQAAAKPSWAS